MHRGRGGERRGLGAHRTRSRSGSERHTVTIAVAVAVALTLDRCLLRCGRFLARRKRALQQCGRQQDHRGRSAVRGGAELDLDVVPDREPADDEEAEPVAVEEVEGLRLLDAPVGLAEEFAAHAEPAVLDLQGVAVADRFAADPHLGVRR